MKEILLQFAKYNVWANKQIINVLLKLEHEQLEQEVTSSFPSLRKTVYHTWSAEYIWLQRLQLTEQPVWIAESFTGTFEEACAEWQKVSEDLAGFVEKQYDDRGFTHALQYYNLKKQPVKLQVSTAMTHVFNHSTYHRGQLVTLLRQVGVNKIPAMDYFIFAK